MVEVKTHSMHPSSMEQRINNRLKPSAGAGAGDVQVTKGTGPTRTVTTIHHCAGARQHGDGNPGEGDINGNKRGVV
jgi:hypothetical protein